MIREITKQDYNIVNILLDEFNYKISDISFDNAFLKVLVYDDGIVKGVIVYELIYDRIEIDYIKTDDRYKRMGIATKLLGYALKDAKNASLEVKTGNHSAIAFYLKNGFKKAAIRRNYYKNQDGILMVREQV